MSQQLIQNFVKHLQNKQKSDSTIIAYRKDIEQIDKLIDSQWQTCDSESLQNALNQLTKLKGLSAKSASRKLNSVRTFCSYLQENNVIEGNPAQAVPHPKYDAAPPRLLTDTEIARIRTACAGQPRDLLVFELLLQTGMRISELSELQNENIRLNGHFKEIEIMDTTQKFPRRIPINERLSEILQSAGLNLEAPENSYLIEGGKRGRPMSMRNIRNNMEKLMQKAGVADATINDLRNTFIVAQLAGGRPLELISQIVGHTNINTTSKYLKLLPENYQPSGEIRLVNV